MASASDTGFNPEECYSGVRRTHKRNSLQAVSRDYEVYFTDIEGNAHHLKEIFQSLFNKLVTEIETDLPDFSHRSRLVLNAPSLNYPIHIPFHPACDFNADLILNEIERVLNSNENFDISDSVKVNILSVSLPVMGGYKLGGIQNRTVPDICSFAKQKKSIITIRDTSDSNDCLLRALAVGVALVERKDSGRYKHLSRVESQTAEKKQLLYRPKRFDGFDCESGSTNRCTTEDLTIWACSSFLKQYMITLFDRNFMGVFIKSFNDGKDKHFDLLYDPANYHVDVISSTKGLFMVRHYCYVCQKGCSNIKHLCTGSCCLLCRQPKCKHRIVYITSSEQPGRTTSFKCDTCGFVLRSQDCLDNHIETRLCSLYSKCSSCSGTIPHHSIANHRCSKKRSSICSQYFDHSSQEVHEGFVQRPKFNVKNASITNVPGSSTQISNDREEEPLVDDVCI